MSSIEIERSTAVVADSVLSNTEYRINTATILFMNIKKNLSSSLEIW